MQDEKTFDTGELTLNYIEAGAGAPMLLLHGLTANKLAWYPVLPELSKHWHLYAPDFRGHGKSGRASDNQYRNQDYARDVIAFLKHLGEPAVVMGHSLGAMVAIVTASQYPAGVRASILLEPPLVSFLDSVHAEPRSAYWFETVALVNQGSPSDDERFARLRARMPDVPDEQVRATAGFISGVAPGAPETALRDEIWGDVDLPQALQQIKCPTLMIYGDWDNGGAVREQDVAFFKANCPSAQVVRLPGADHGLKMTDQPEIVLQQVNQFLQSI